MKEAAEIIRYWIDSWIDIGEEVRTKMAGDFLSRLSKAGYAIVPVEPTDKMVEAGWDAATSYMIGHTIEDIYRAMISAHTGGRG